MSNTFWDSKRATYRDKSGKEIVYDRIRNSVEAVAEDARGRIRALAEKYNASKLTLPEFVTQAEPIIRKSLISSGVIAAGGKEQMTAVLNGRLGSIVKFHLEKWRGFYTAIDNGELSAKQILARADLYGAIPVRVFEEMRKGVMADSGYTKAENILGAAEKHCTECPGLTAQGRIDIEMMPAPGTRICGNLCHCRVLYS